MHQCLKCGRTISTLAEIENGCSCGSKVFVFSRHGSASPLHPAAASSTSASNGAGMPARGASAPSAAPAPFAAPARKSKMTLMSFPAPKAEPVPPAPAQAEKAAPVQPPAENAQAAPPAAENVQSFENLSPSSAQPPAEKVRPAPPKFENGQAAQKLSPSSAPALAHSPIVASAPISDEEETELLDEPASEVWLAKGGQVTAISGVENVRQLKRGVYEVDVRGLSSAPLVVRDAEGVYYVRLPFAALPDHFESEIPLVKK